jgi:hypothetical protein
MEKGGHILSFTYSFLTPRSDHFKIGSSTSGQVNVEAILTPVS